MTARVEYRVVVERDGQQWPLDPPYREPTTSREAVEALIYAVLNPGHVPLNAPESNGEPFVVPPWGDSLGSASPTSPVSISRLRFDRVFIVHREVTETPWLDDRGRLWDEQAARDGLLAVANERRFG